MSLIEACDRQLPWLQRRVSASHSFQFPSQHAARNALLAMYEWKNAGRDGLPPEMSVADLRAGIYDFARSSAQLQAYRQVVALSILEHLSLTFDRLAVGNLLTGMSSLRGFIERIAALTDNYRRLSRELCAQDLKIEEVHAASEVILKTLYGTRLNWQAIAGQDIKSLNYKELAYEPKPKTANSSARNVLNGIDALDRRVSGARVAYDILCEFLHPNIGDLVGSTMNTKSYYDQWNTRHVTRLLGIGPCDVKSQNDFFDVLTSVSAVVSEMVDLLPSLFEELDELVSKVIQVTRKAQHKIVRNNQDIFRRTDPCPCLSGKQIRICAPTALKL